MQKHKYKRLSIKEWLSKLQRFTTENLAKAETNRLGKDAHKLIVERYMEKERVEKMKLDAIRDK